MTKQRAVCSLCSEVRGEVVDVRVMDEDVVRLTQMQKAGVGVCTLQWGGGGVTLESTKNPLSWLCRHQREPREQHRLWQGVSIWRLGSKNGSGISPDEVSALEQPSRSSPVWNKPIWINSPLSEAPIKLGINFISSPRYWLSAHSWSSDWSQPLAHNNNKRVSSRSLANN